MRARNNEGRSPKRPRFGFPGVSLLANFNIVSLEAYTKAPLSEDA
ncbi:MAG TPA: hypothetical protein VEC12_15325 [Bacteroidia bacterium]|nr:hypothetical protein [Bacteroidia bacterium]